MTREVYANKKFIEFSRNYVLVRAFQDTEPQGDRLASKFRIRGFPTLLLLDSSGKEVERILGFRSAEELMEEIRFAAGNDGDDSRITI